MEILSFLSNILVRWNNRVFVVDDVFGFGLLGCLGGGRKELFFICFFWFCFLFYLFIALNNVTLKATTNWKFQ